MIDCRSSLIALAGRFTDKFSPFQAISLEPGPGGSGVLVFASNRGASAFVALDPKGVYDDPAPRLKVLPTSELLGLCKGIKSAERSVRIDGETAVVSTYTKSTTSQRETPVAYSTLPCLSARDCCAIATRVKWCPPGGAAGLLGRYDIALVRDMVRILEDQGDPVILSIGQGSPENEGADRPLRVFSESLNAMAIVMPQKRRDTPYPPMPEWLSQVARGPALSDSPTAP